MIYAVLEIFLGLVATVFAIYFGVHDSIFGAVMFGIAAIYAFGTGVYIGLVETGYLDGPKF